MLGNSLSSINGGHMWVCLCLCVRVRTGVCKCEISRKRDSWLRWYPCKREGEEKQKHSEWKMAAVNVACACSAEKRPGRAAAPYVPLVQVFSLNYS